MPTDVPVGKWIQSMWNLGVRLAEESEKVAGTGEYMRTTYPYQKLFSQNKLTEDIKSGLKFGVVDCSIEVLERLSEKQWISPFLKNCDVSLEELGPHIKDFALEYNRLKKPRGLLISSFCL